MLTALIIFSVIAVLCALGIVGNLVCNDKKKAASDAGTSKAASVENSDAPIIGGESENVK